MVAVAIPKELRGAQQPRIVVEPEGEEHPLWGEVVEFVAALGVKLDTWQMRVLHASLLRNAGFWAAFAVAVCCPRQNGKNRILEVRELIGPLVLGEKLLIHTAHLADTSKEAFRRLDDLIDANDWLSSQVKHIWRTNGHESIEFKDGRRIRFRTRTRGGGRGFSGSPVFFDEAMFLPEVSMGSILPVISAQPDPQVWYMGSAVDQMEHEDGVTFARVRERALKGDDPRLAYFEWSLDGATPDEVEADEAADPQSWARTNPALGVRISADYVRAEQRELAPRTFAVERLGVGDWPPTHQVDGEVIALDDWNRLTDDRSEIVGPVCFALDVRPNRANASISVAGHREDGLAHVELVQRDRGTGWIGARLAELVKQHETVGVMCDSYGPAGSLVHELAALDVEVTLVNAGDHARACGQIFDLVDQKALRHLGQPELAQAIKAATKRPLGDAWAWSRKGGVDISPLVAATLALWGIETLEPEAEAWSAAW